MYMNGHNMDNALAELPKNSVGSVTFRAANPTSAAERTVATALLPLQSGIHIHLANAYSVALAEKDDAVRASFENGINFPDGRPLQWVSALRVDKEPLCQVRGPSFLLDTFSIGEGTAVKHYLLGSTPAVLESLTKNLQNKFPGCLIVGTDSPPFRAMSDAELKNQDERILRSGADIVWVGLGTPKQDFEAARIAANIPVVSIAIGAAFDFAAGTRKEAPGWMSRLGIEWLFRLSTEPKRLWKRYLFGNTQFIVAAARHWNRSNTDSDTLVRV
jgi:N-acetylglucosaminyldiphosphoundecaprenol N-acetyl-beta-D-mannosaminyltransferase